MKKKNLVNIISAAIFGLSSLASSLFGTESNASCQNVIQHSCELEDHDKLADQNQPIAIKALFPKIADGLTKATKVKK